MSKYTLTLEQFKEIIMPFINEAIEENAEKVKARKFKLGEIRKVTGDDHLLTKWDDRVRDFKIEFISVGFHGYFAYSIDDGASMELVEFPDSPITDYMLDHRAEINNAFRKYMYQLYGEEYKGYLIEHYQTLNEEILEKLQKEIHQKEKEIAWLKREERSAQQNYEEEIKEIENLLKSYNV